MDIESLISAAAGQLLGGGLSEPNRASPIDQLNAGVFELRRRGHSVRPAECVPGLWDVSGLGELTTGQVKSFAALPYSQDR